MHITGAALKGQYDAAMTQWPFLHTTETTHDLPRFLLFAVGSRETNLDKKYTQGTTGDGGHGHGLFQLDDRWNLIPEGFDVDARAQAERAAEQLAGLYEVHGDWIRSLNAYNSGSPLTEKTTGKDYGPDVWARRTWLLDDLLPPLDDSTPGDIERNRGPRVEVRQPAPPVASLLDVRGLALLGQPTPEKEIGFFVRNDGLAEKPDGSNINWITDWYGMHDAWCAMACYRASLEAGFTADGETVIIPGVGQRSPKGSPYVPELYWYFHDAGLTGDEPRPGAWGIVVYPESGSWRDPYWQMPGDHVCVVEYVADDGSIVTRDGNVSNSIAQRRRSRSLFHGFCYPPYEAVEEDDMFDAKDRENLTFAAQVAGPLRDVFEALGPVGGPNQWEKGAEKLVELLKKAAAKGTTTGGGVSADEVRAIVAAELAKLQLVATKK